MKTTSSNSEKKVMIALGVVPDGAEFWYTGRKYWYVARRNLWVLVAERGQKIRTFSSAFDTSRESSRLLTYEYLKQMRSR